MSIRHLLYVGNAKSDIKEVNMARALQESIDFLEVTTVANGVEALATLAQNSGKFVILVIDLLMAGIPEGGLITGINEINPMVETILLGQPGQTWAHLDLPRYNRPVFLSRPFSADSLISTTTKLLDIIEVKQDYAMLSRGFKGYITLARRNVEAVLGLLNRPVGVGMISMRNDGFFTFYNPEATRLTGYCQEEVPHIRKWADSLLRDPGTIQSFLTKLNRFWVEGPTREDLQLWIRTKEGVALKLSVAVLLLQDDKGEPRQMVILLFNQRERIGVDVYKLLLKESPLGLYTYYPREGMDHISMAAIELINQSFNLNLLPEEMLGRQITDLPIPDRTADQWQQWLEKIADGNTNETGLLPPMGLPGQRILAHSFFSTFKSERGQKGVLAIIGRKMELQSDNYKDLSYPDLCQLTLMNVPQSFLLFSAQRTKAREIKKFICLGANSAAISLFGQDDSPLKGMTLENIFFDPVAAEVILKQALELTEYGGDYKFELPYHEKPYMEEPRTYSIWMAKMGDGVAIFIRDVTVQREEVRLLKQYQHVFTHMEDSIIVSDLDGNIIDWNPASQRMFGYEKEEILGKQAFILTKNDDGEPIPQEAREILREGDVWKGEYQFTRRDGRPGVASNVFALLRDDKNRPYGTVGLSRDITESKRMEERLTYRTQELQEKNIALNTLLRHAEEERLRACEQVASEVTGKITEGLHQILGAKSNPELVDNLSRLLLEDLGRNTKTKGDDDEEPIYDLTEKEMEVARLIRLGKTTEEIAFILDKSPDTVRLQRISIRKKLGLDSRDKNLMKHLKKLDMF